MTIEVPAKEVTNAAMIAGNEKTYSIVIDSDIVKEWVGIGWINLHMATAEDIEKYPTVTRK